MCSVMLQVFVLVTLLAVFVNCLNGRGLVGLDSASFDKIVNKFAVTLVKFDKYYPYGDAHTEYVKLCQSAADMDDLLVAEVGVKDYGDNENQDVLDHLKLKFDDLPQVAVFKQGVSNPVIFTGPVIDVDSLRVFLLKAADVWVPRTGCIPAMDRLALQLPAAVAAEDSTHQLQLLMERAGQQLRKLPADQMVTGQYYVKLLELLAAAEAPTDVTTMLTTERQRVDKLLAGKLSDKKRRELLARRNVLLSFSTESSPPVKDEL